MTELPEDSLVRAVIVDDEEPARRLLRSMLGAWPRLCVVGEAGGGELAISMIRELRPDLVFLDVQMPGKNGFDVLAALEEPLLPLVVFVTAYDRYALDAFEVSACDYLLKPFDDRRLAIAVNRALGRHRQPAQDIDATLRTLLRQAQRPAPRPVAIRVEGRHILLRPEDIDWIEAAGKECRVHVGTTVHTVRVPLAALAAQLDAANFLRVHRSSIVNTLRIREVQPWFRGEYVIILVDGTRITTGGSYRDGVSRLLGRDR
jgi:two-component system, LytTR family, response regulator